MCQKKILEEIESCKVFFLGEKPIGKTSLITQFIYKAFEEPNTNIEDIMKNQLFMIIKNIKIWNM